MTIDAFISHAHDDAALAKKIVDFLVMGPGLTYQDIRCTSFVPAGLVVGDDIAKQLRKDIEDSFVFLPLITRNYANSDYVVFELGAAWGLEAKILPVADDIAKVKIPDLLRGLHICDINKKEDIIALGEAINNEVFETGDRVDIRQIMAAAERFILDR